jgi:hypothetical protein
MGLQVEFPYSVAEFHSILPDKDVLVTRQHTLHIQALGRWIMVVQTLDRHPGRSGVVVGLHIGIVNVQQYFPHRVDQIELELDHLCIVCPLEPSFWLDRPEIHDLRLSSWLESKRNSGKLAASSGAVALIPSGEHAFRLQLIVRDEVVDEADRLVAGDPAAVIVSQIPSPLSALDRRKRVSERKPERRKVARLRNDEFPSTSKSN